MISSEIGVSRMPHFYEQLAEILRGAIRSDLFLGGRIPPETELSKRYNVSVTVIKAATKLLEAEGLILTVPHRGRFVVSSNSVKSIAKNQSVIYISFEQDRWNLLSNGPSLYNIAIERLRQKAKENGYQLLIQPFCEGESWHMNSLVSNAALGSVLAFHYRRAEIFRKMLPASVPVVSLDHCVIQEAGDGKTVEGVSYVTCDNLQAGRMIGEHLRAKGHRKVAFFNSGQVGLDYPTTRDRILGCREAGIHFSENDFFTETSPKLLKKIASAGYTAIVACNDQHAILVINHILAAGLKIPGDISIIGFDDILPMIKEIHPQLTTVAMPCVKMAEAAWEILNGRNRTPSDITVLPYQFVERESVGILKNHAKGGIK